MGDCQTQLDVKQKASPFSSNASRLAGPAGDLSRLQAAGWDFPAGCRDTLHTADLGPLYHDKDGTVCLGQGRWLHGDCWVSVLCVRVTHNHVTQRPQPSAEPGLRQSPLKSPHLPLSKGPQLLNPNSTAAKTHPDVLTRRE